MIATIGVLRPDTPPDKGGAAGAMSASNHARLERGDGGAGEGGEDAPPPARRTRAAVAAARAYDSAYAHRLKLTDIIGYVALNGYAREAAACAGLNRETWTCVPAGLSADDADRVRAGHPLWQAIINLRHGYFETTRLGWAAKEGKLARVRELCDWHADLEAADICGSTPLYNAVVFCHTGSKRDIVCQLLSRGANTEAAHVTTGSTCLHQALSCGDFDIARDLLAHGANTEAAEIYGGSTGLHIAAKYGNAAIVHDLIACGSNIEAVTSRGVTSLILACQHGRIGVVRELLDRGANIEATYRDGETSLHAATQSGHCDILRELLDRGANIMAADDEGYTSLHVACLLGVLDNARELITRGADIEATTEFGETPLMMASKYGYVEVVRALLSAHANSHYQDDAGDSARSVACDDVDPTSDEINDAGELIDEEAFDARVNATRAAILALLDAA